MTTVRRCMQELAYLNGSLVSGSLEALIDLLIPTTTTYPERSYVFAFILCSRLFLRPYELLGRVVQVRWWVCHVVWVGGVHGGGCVMGGRGVQCRWDSAIKVVGGACGVP